MGKNLAPADRRWRWRGWGGTTVDRACWSGGRPSLDDVDRRRTLRRWRSDWLLHLLGQLLLHLILWENLLLQLFLLGQLLLNLDMRLILGRHHLLLVLHRLLYGLLLDKDSFRTLLLNYGLLLNWLLCGLLLNKNLFRLSLLLDNGLLLNWRLHWLHVLHWLLVFQGRRWLLRILCLNRLCLLLVTQGSSRIVNFNLNRDGTILRDKRHLLLLFFPVLVFFDLALLLVGGHVF